MNREITSNLWPINGDVSSEAGNTQVTVTGIQSVPVVAVAMQGGEFMAYDVNIAKWNPHLRACVQVNNITVSDDPYISVNVVKPILVNGV